MTHYFKNTEGLSQNRRNITFRFLGVPYVFETDDGVFSKDEADEGSLFLVKTMLDDEIGQDVLDLGSGYGLMSLILKHERPACRITAYEVNERAHDCALNNAKHMGLDVRFICQDISEGIEGEYDTVMTNPPIRAGKGVVYAFFKKAAQHLRPEGSLYVVMRRSHGSLSAIQELKGYFKEVSLLKKHRGFEVIKSKYPLTLD